METFKILSFNKKNDKRGSFIKIFDLSDLYKNLNFIYKNSEICISNNIKKFTFRGFHYQAFPNYQKKIVYCNKGKIIDYFIDVRKKSPNYLKVFKYLLKENDSKAIYIPKGFAHGFLTLKDNTEIIYIISGDQKKYSEKGIRYNDPILKYAKPKQISVISKRDLNFINYKK
jgi:dTDP-4-dehydrorhamnose 3,5-epimerase